MKNIFQFAILTQSFNADISVRITGLKRPKNYLTVVRFLINLYEIVYKYVCMYYLFMVRKKFCFLKKNIFVDV